MFNKNTGSEVITHIKALWSVQPIQYHDRYLGLASFVGRSKHASFQEIKEKI